MRSRAVRAFWAMHVEAMTWSRMGVRDYAAARQLSPTSLRKWRDRLHDGEMEIDRRAHLAGLLFRFGVTRKPRPGLARVVQPGGVRSFRYCRRWGSGLTE